MLFKPVYPALRLDLRLSHVAAAAARLATLRSANSRRAIAAQWGGNEAIAFLSARSAFSALLEAYNWPTGSEIMVTGINIADMGRIIESFGLVAVPIDLDAATLAPDPAEIAARCTAATRALLTKFVAHLAGQS